MNNREVVDNIYNKVVRGELHLAPNEIIKLMEEKRKIKEHDEELRKMFKPNPTDAVKGFIIRLKDGTIKTILFEEMTTDFFDLTKFDEWIAIW